MDIKKTIFLVLIIGSMISSMNQTGFAEINQPKTTTKKTIEIYAHRGIAAFWPENTLIGYEKSIELGVTGLDIDVAITKDNIIVGSHDPFLNKHFTRDKTKQWLADDNIIISNLNFAELADYDVGKINPNSSYGKHFNLRESLDNISIPSLEQVIALIKTKGSSFHKLQIEIKTDPKLHNDQYIENFVRQIIAVLNKNNFISQAELQSFDWRTLLYAKKIAPSVRTSYITQQHAEFNTFADRNTWFGLRPKLSWTAGYKLKDFNNSVPFMISKLGGDIWCPSYTDLTQELVAMAQSYNLKVIPWTVDDKSDMQKLIDLDVDGIITNRSDLLREVLAYNNILLP